MAKCRPNWLSCLSSGFYGLQSWIINKTYSKTLCMLFCPVRVSLKGFSISFKVHLACCDLLGFTLIVHTITWSYVYQLLWIITINEFFDFFFLINQSSLFQFKFSGSTLRLKKTMSICWWTPFKNLLSIYLLDIHFKPEKIENPC